MMKRMAMVRSKPTSIELRSAIETLMDFSFSFFMESEEVQRSKVACLFVWSKLELKTILVETFKCTL